MHHSWWSYNKTATHERQENLTFRRWYLSPLDVWVSATTSLCSIFLPVLVKAIPCIDKDLGMCTIAYASLMVELQQELTATHERQENPTFRRWYLSPLDVWVSATTFLCSIFLPVLVKAIPCIDKDLGMFTIAYASLMVELQQDGYTWKTRESDFSRRWSICLLWMFGCPPLPSCALFSCQCLSKPSHV